MDHAQIYASRLGLTFRENMRVSLQSVGAVPIFDFSYLEAYLSVTF